MTTHNAESIARALGGQSASDGWWRARCPAHNSKTLAFALKDMRGGTFVMCHAGCDEAALRPALEARGIDTMPPPCTVENYAALLRLPVEHLQKFGLANRRHDGLPSVAIPCLNEHEQAVATRYRLALGGSDEFRWTKGAKPCLYGANNLRGYRKDAITIVEGESDAITLWWEGYQAVGLPGASSWHEARHAPLLAEFERIYIVIEPDRGGDRVVAWLSRSSIRERVYLVTLPDG